MNKKAFRQTIGRINFLEQGYANAIADSRVYPMAQSLGIEFDGNTVISNNTNDRLDAVENKANTNENNILINQQDINDINNKLSSLANLFGVTFNSDGTINTENYTTHTHNYYDKTIDENGNETDTQRTTNGVS